MPYQRITSVANAHIRELIRIKSGPSADAFFIEGPHLINAALDAAVSVREVFFTAPFASSAEGEGLLLSLEKKTGRIFEVSDQVLKKLSDTEAPQGIIGLAAQPAVKLIQLSPGKSPLIVIIDGVQDPGNLGTIIRIADAAAADVVIVLPGSCEPYMPKVVRATAGSLFNIPVIREQTDACLSWLRAKGIALAVTAAGGSRSIFAAPLTGPLAFAFGSEARGVSPHLREAADFSLSIPIYGRAESLNVAAAAAVCLYEAARQRRTPEHTA